MNRPTPVRRVQIPSPPFERGPFATSALFLRHRRRIRTKARVEAVRPDRFLRGAGLLSGFLVVLGLLVMGVIGGVALSADAVYNHYAVGLPSTDQLRTISLPATIRIYDRTGTVLLGMRYAEDRDLVTFDQLPTPFVQATVDVEDHTFWTNPGVDVSAIIRAVMANADVNGPLQGASTITQQVVKHYLVGDEQTLDRKIREAILAERLSHEFSKAQILTLYLNTNFYGHGAYGPAAAARRYFDLPLERLSLGQLALLAGLPQSPTALDPFNHPAAARARQAVVLAAMVREGDITAAAANFAGQAGFGLSEWQKPADQEPWLVERALGEARTALGPTLETCNCSIITTLDLGLQKIATDKIRDFLAKVPKSDNLHNAAAVIEDPHTGELLAYVGSRDPTDTSPKVQGLFDSAGAALRAPGSAWKPIVYLDAFEASGINAASRVWDVETTFAKGYRPHDYFTNQSGPMTIRQALRESRNIPAIRTMLAYGGGGTGMWAMAQRLGITTDLTPDQLGPASAIGVNGVHLVDMAEVFSTIDALGLKPVQHTVLRVEDWRGQDIKPALAAPTQVIDSRLTYQMVDILRNNADNGPDGSWLTGYRGDIGRPAFVKTGTDDGVRDTYAIGGVPDLVLAVWVGNADNSSMAPSRASFASSLVIWHNILKAAATTARAPTKDWARPDGLVAARVCADRHKYSRGGVDEALSGCPFGWSTEWVIAGFSDPETRLADQGALYGVYNTDGAGHLLRSSCPSLDLHQFGVLAKAEIPAWQSDLNRWVSAARAGLRNWGSRFAWQNVNWIEPALGGACPSAPPPPSPEPSPTPGPIPTPPPADCGHGNKPPCPTPTP
jgi:membrane peptidoglycan carboxypeptidase